MPLYEIVSTDQPFASVQLIAPDPANILTIVQQLECANADVMCDGEYAFSIRLGADGARTIFPREESEISRIVPTYGQV